MREKSQDQRWAFLCRSGTETDLITELGRPAKAIMIGEGVVLCERRERGPDAVWVDPAFARQAMRTDGRAYDVTIENLAQALGRAIVTGMRRPVPWSLQVIAPDAKGRDPRRRVAKAIDEVIAEALDKALPREIADRYVESEDAERLAQIWIVDEQKALVGLTRADEAITRDPGGRRARTEDLPSPIARKLVEAFDWLGHGPGRGERVVSIGAPSAGWAKVAEEAGAKVELIHDRGDDIRSPFKYAPEETVDWLFVVLGHRPLEVAKLIAKWGRRAWAQQFIANLLLPMNAKAALVEDARKLLEEAGWKGVRMRQLSSDKSEITVYGWLDPAIAVLGRQEPFKLRQATGRRDEKAALLAAKDKRKMARKKKRKVSIKQQGQRLT